MIKNSPVIKVKIQNEDFDVSEETRFLKQNNTGAIVNFVGIVRGYDEKNNRTIYSMKLEHYPGMSEATLEEIAQKAKKEWPIDSITIVHRVGRLKPGEMIVFVGCASAHRHAAFDGCQYIMDYLKTDAPFWKAEETKDGTTWVSERENDKAAKRRWHLRESN